MTVCETNFAVSASFNYAEHNQVPSVAIREVRSGDIFATSTDMTITVLRHIYGLPWFEDFSDSYVHDVTGRGWVSLCDAADEYEVPSLRKYIKDKLETHLETLLEKGLSGAETAMQQFVELVTEIYEAAEKEETAALEVIAKLICNHYPALRRQGSFAELMEESMGDCSEFLQAVVVCAARDGIQCAK